jgi:hypothetical protein
VDFITKSRLYTFILASMFIVMTTLIILLIQQNYYFKQYINELTNLKEQYNSHVITLKRLFLETEHADDEHESENEKKKDFEDLL